MQGNRTADDHDSHLQQIEQAGGLFQRSCDLYRPFAIERLGDHSVLGAFDRDGANDSSTAFVRPREVGGFDRQVHAGVRYDSTIGIQNLHFGVGADGNDDLTLLIALSSIARQISLTLDDLGGALLEERIDFRRDLMVGGDIGRAADQ